MKVIKKVSLMVFIATCFLSVNAQENSIAIINIESLEFGMNSKEVTSFIRKEIDKSETIKSVSHEKIESVILNNPKVNSSCLDSNCIKQLSLLVEAQKLVYGDVSVEKKNFIMNLKFYNSNNGLIDSVLKIEFKVGESSDRITLFRAVSAFLNGDYEEVELKEPEVIVEEEVEEDIEYVTYEGNDDWQEFDVRMKNKVLYPASFLPKVIIYNRPLLLLNNYNEFALGLNYGLNSKLAAKSTLSYLPHSKSLQLNYDGRKEPYVIKGIGLFQEIVYKMSSKKMDAARYFVPYISAETGFKYKYHIVKPSEYYYREGESEFTSINYILSSKVGYQLIYNKSICIDLFVSMDLEAYIFNDHSQVFAYNSSHFRPNLGLEIGYVLK